MVLSLRKKTLFFITVTLIALTVILYFAISINVRGSFETLEEEDFNKHVLRVNEAIDNELGDINSKLNDWAKPGQELDVVRLASLLDGERTRPSDQRGNKLADLLANLDVNVFLWTDSRNKIFWGWSYNEETRRLDLVSRSLKQELTTGSPLLQHPQGDGTVKGLLLLPEDPMLVVSAPILYRLPVPLRGWASGKWVYDDGEVLGQGRSRPAG